MDYDGLIAFIQCQFTDGLAMVVGSGLSTAEGMPGMPALADYLSKSAGELTGPDEKLWLQIKSVLDAREGLEAALLKNPPSCTLETWIASKTCDLLLPKERDVIREVFSGTRTLRLTTFLTCVLKSPNGLPILTPNYDRLIEVACEMAGFHVDTTAVGQYAGVFDHARRCVTDSRGCRGRRRQGWNEGDGQTWTGAGIHDDEPFPLDLYAGRQCMVEGQTPALRALRRGARPTRTARSGRLA
jgi:hypothetical protein